MISENFINLESNVSNKYELSENYKELRDAYGHKHKLYQVRSLKDFGNVKKGDLGCWVERYFNLDQEGTCWPDQKTVIYDSGRVSGDAVVTACSLAASFVFGTGTVVKNSELLAATVSGGCVVRSSVVHQSSITGPDSTVINSTITERCSVKGACHIDNATISGSTLVTAKVSESTLEGQILTSVALCGCHLTNTITGFSDTPCYLQGVNTPVFC